MFNFRKSGSTATTPASTSQFSTSASKPVSPGTLAFYHSLCLEKGVQPVHTEEATHAEVQATIEELRKLPNFRPASEAQINHIKNRTIDLELPMIEKKMSMLEASELIQKLDTMFVARGLDKRVSVKQLELLEKMSKCPDIPLFTIHLSAEMLHRGDELQAAYDLALHNLNVGKGTEETLLLLEDEMKLFQAECIAYTEGKDLRKLDKDLASEFISAYQKVYYAWQNSRASEGQRALLKTLSARTGEAFSDDMLLQYSSAEANKMIDQLQKEMGRTYPSTLEPEALTIKKGGKNAEEAREISEAELHGAIHSLYASIGQEADADTLHRASFSEIIDLVSLLPIYGIDEEAVREMLGNIFDEDEMAMIMLPYTDK